MLILGIVSGWLSVAIVWATDLYLTGDQPPWTAEDPIHPVVCAVGGLLWPIWLVMIVRERLR